LEFHKVEITERAWSQRYR